jgi:hypothetical protein
MENQTTLALSVAAATERIVTPLIRGVIQDLPLGGVANEDANTPLLTKITSRGF